MREGDDTEPTTNLTDIIDAWRAATADPSDGTDEAHQLGAYQREINGDLVWILTDRRGQVVEIADSAETLAKDHPNAKIVMSTGEHTDAVQTGPSLLPMRASTESR